MQNRLSQGLIALKYFEALMIKERHSGANRMTAKAGSGILTGAQPHEAVSGDDIRWSEWQRNLPFSYFVAPETKPKVSHMPGKHATCSYISRLALC